MQLTEAQWAAKKAFESAVDILNAQAMKCRDAGLEVQLHDWGPVGGSTTFIRPQGAANVVITKRETA